MKGNSVVMVTGGAGFIGSHTVIALQESGKTVLVLDNLSNSSERALASIHKVTGCVPIFVQGDVQDEELLDAVFRKYKVEAVMHFAGLKSVSESVSEPLRYYNNNVLATIKLCLSMRKAGVFTLVFSSSATVYGEMAVVPISESDSSGFPTNPYGRTKKMVETLLTDLSESDDRWKIACLRYFNPVGAHNSGLIGESPLGVPNNLFPYIAKVAAGAMPELKIFGDDYDTKDGTGVRDYIHVMDLAEGHLAALNALMSTQGICFWNLGTGKGYSVLEVLREFEAVNNCKVPYKVVARRAGDIATSYANPAKASRELGWSARRDLAEMVRDAWRWQTADQYDLDI